MIKIAEKYVPGDIHGKRRANRFLVRKEYFGGLIYDRRTKKEILLDGWQYGFVRSLGNRDANRDEDPAGADEKKEIKERFARELEEKGVIIDGRLDADYIEVPIIKEGVLSAPLRTYYHITFGCNLSCEHCMVGNEERGDDELATEEAIDVLRQLEEIGNPELRITGGEPTIRPDLFDIIHDAVERSMDVVVNTNGIFGDKTREKIIHSGLNALVISLDGDREVHDRRRGKGTFDRTIETIQYIADYNRTAGKKINVCINPTISKENAHLAEFLIHKAIELGGAELGMEVNFMPLRPFGRACDITPKMLTAEGWYRFSEDIARIRGDPRVKESGIPVYSRNMDLFGCYDDCRGRPFPFDRSSCGAATFRMGLSPNGAGNVCGFIGMEDEFRTPTTREASILEIWHSDAFEKLRNATKEPCESCDYYRKECVGVCKAMSYITTGDLGRFDPYCFAHLLGKNGCNPKD